MITMLSPEQVSREVRAHNLLAVAQAFLADKARQCTPRTHENYVNDLRPFLDWWEGQAKEFDHLLGAETFTAFVEFLGGEYRSTFGNVATTHTQWRVTRRVRQLLRWAHAQGFVPVEIADLCPLVEDSGSVKFYPSIEELHALMQAADGEMRLRDAALLAFSISTGARRYEVAQACVKDLHFDSPPECIDAGGEHAGWVHLRRVKYDAEGKRGGRVSAFDGACGLLLKTYLRSVNRREGPLFGLSDVGIGLVVKRLGDAAGITEIHPHAFRSAFVDHWSETHMDAGTMADVALKLQVGHQLPRSDVTVHRYLDHGNRRKVLRWIRRFHTSPLMAMEWDWTQWPVHNPTN